MVVAAAWAPDGAGSLIVIWDFERRFGIAECVVSPGLRRGAVIES